MKKIESIIEFKNVDKSFFSQKLYKNVNLQLNPGDKIGLMGINGVGKSTLIKLMTDDEQPDEGTVLINPKYKVACFDQFGKIDPTLKVEELLNIPFERVIFLQKELERVGEQFNDDVAHNERLMDKYSQLNDEFESLGGYSYIHIQAEFANVFGFTDKLQKPFGLLSGGEKQYIRLAITLFSESDLLILDEPLTFFDKQKTAWLLNYVKESRKAILVVSHNVDFIRAFANKIFDISNYTVTQYETDYNQYLKDKKIKIKEEKVLNRKATEIIKEIEEAIAKKENIMDKTENKRGHAVILRRLERELVALGRDIIEFSPDYKYKYADAPEELYFQNRDMTEHLVQLKDVSKEFADKVLYTDVNLAIEKDTKICIVGANGSGKSTLAKMILGEEKPTSGEIIWNKRAEMAFVPQETIFKNEKLTTVEYLKEETGLSEDFIEIAVDTLYNNEEGFREKKLVMLSGGEKKRLEIFARTLSDIDLLIIDEPTTYMDDYSRTTIASMLLDYEGAVILITHDKGLMKKLDFQVYDIRDKKFRIKEGQ